MKSRCLVSTTAVSLNLDSSVAYTPPPIGLGSCPPHASWEAGDVHATPVLPAPEIAGWVCSVSNSILSEAPLWSYSQYTILKDAFDVVIFSLTVVKAITHFRAQMIHSPLLYTFYRDGVLRYLLICGEPSHLSVVHRYRLITYHPYFSYQGYWGGI